MPCLISAGLTRDCSMTTGGLSDLVIGNLSDVLSYTQDATGLITALELKPNAVFYRFEFEKNTASANQPLQVGANKYVQPAVAFTMKGYNQTSKEVMDNLAVAEVVALVKLRGSNEWFAYGLNNGLEASATEGNTGAGEGDLNGFTITLTGVETEFANQIQSSVVDAIVQDLDEPVITNVSSTNGNIFALSNLGLENLTLIGENFTGATNIYLVDTTTLAETEQNLNSVDSDTQITGTTASTTAGNYYVKVVTPNGDYTYTGVTLVVV